MAATTIAVSAGNNQVGLVSTVLPVALAVLITDGAGLPVAGTTVNWKVSMGGGSVAAATSSSNASGIASIAWTLGPTNGPQVVSAWVDGLTGSPQVFAATAALVTVQNVKDYFRIEQSAEDTLLADLIAEAQGNIEYNVGRSLTHRTEEWFDDAQTLRMGEGCTNLILSKVPIDPDSLVVTDGLGVVVDPATYQLRQDKGLICALGFGSGAFIAGPYSTFDKGPYSISCVAGLDLSATYAVVELPMIRSLIIDYVGFLYQQRTPGARIEKVSQTVSDYEVDEATGLPKRISRGIRKLRGVVYGR